MENKQAFVVCMQAAYIAGDNIRYAHLVRHPVEYLVIRGREYLFREGRRANITGCSCAAIADVFANEFL